MALKLAYGEKHAIVFNKKNLLSHMQVLKL